MDACTLTRTRIGSLLVQPAELHSHPLWILDLEAGLGGPCVRQVAALQLGLQRFLLRVPVGNGVGDVIDFGRTAGRPVPGNQYVIAEHQAALFAVVLCNLHPEQIHVEVADLLVIVHLIRDVVDVEGLELLACALGRRRHPGRSSRRYAETLDELPAVHLSLFEVLQQFRDDVFHLSSLLKSAGRPLGSRPEFSIHPPTARQGPGGGPVSKSRALPPAWFSSAGESRATGPDNGGWPLPAARARAACPSASRRSFPLPARSATCNAYLSPTIPRSLAPRPRRCGAPTSQTHCRHMP